MRREGGRGAYLGAVREIREVTEEVLGGEWIGDGASMHM